MDQERKSFTDDEYEAIVQSMCGPMASKIKVVMKKALKNRQLGENIQLTSMIDLILEQLIPQFCLANYSNSKNLNQMHNLVYLLQMKVQTVFTSGVIRTCIDQNWDLKGLKAVILRILKILEIEEQDKRISTLFDKLVQSQNLQSQACIKAIAYFLKNARKAIEEDDLRNPILTYQTTFNFVRDDIQHFRDQKMKASCFSVLHPWAYDLDSVDFKYIVNRDLVTQICSKLKSRNAQVFWLSFFKSQLSCSADEFFTTIKELSEINLIPSFYLSKLESYKAFMQKCDYVVSVNEHADLIQDFIEEFHKAASSTAGFSVLKDQIRTISGKRDSTEYIDEDKIKVYRIEQEPSFTLFTKGSLQSMSFVSYSNEQLRSSIHIYRRVIGVEPHKTSQKKITLKFISVDTDELQGTEINYTGSNGFYKVGEGDLNHYQILNDKKLWESQFMLVCKDGQFFIRDLGIVHTSRVKVDRGLEVQIQRGSVVDMGKVIHYHFDKVTTKDQPQTDSTKTFLVMRPNDKYTVEDEDPVIRARPTWVSQDENKDMIQNEILITVDEGKNIFSVGRSVKRDIEIKLKAVSADHCTIAYTDSKGWIIHENGKDRPSSNGTFVFMKSQQQMDDHEPSALIPLHDGMILSFINYELQVQINDKDQDEILLEEDERKKRLQKQQEEQKENRYEENFDKTYSQRAQNKLYEEVSDPKKAHDLQQQKDFDKKVYGKKENDNVIKAPPVDNFDLHNRRDEEENKRLEEEEKRKELERLALLKRQQEEEEERQRLALLKRQQEEEEERQRLAQEEHARQVEAQRKKEEQDALERKTLEEEAHKAEQERLQEQARQEQEAQDKAHQEEQHKQEEQIHEDKAQDVHHHQDHHQHPEEHKEVEKQVDIPQDHHQEVHQQEAHHHQDEHKPIHQDIQDEKIEHAVEPVKEVHAQEQPPHHEEHKEPVHEQPKHEEHPVEQHHPEVHPAEVHHQQEHASEAHHNKELVAEVHHKEENVVEVHIKEEYVSEVHHKEEHAAEVHHKEEHAAEVHHHQEKAPEEHKQEQPVAVAEHKQEDVVQHNSEVHVTDAVFQNVEAQQVQQEMNQEAKQE